MQIEPRAGWAGILRDDGTLIVQSFHGTWFVLPRDDRPAFGRCPACNRELESEDAANIKAKTEALTKSSMKLGEATYKAQQADAAAGAQATGGTAGAQAGGAQDGKVVDADFEEVDDQKKKA